MRKQIYFFPLLNALMVLAIYYYLLSNHDCTWHYTLEKVIDEDFLLRDSGY